MHQHLAAGWPRFSAPDTGATGAAAGPVRFAMIGDYGKQNGDFADEGKVPEFVKSWDPDFIVTLGDNAYSDHNDHQNAFQVDALDFYGDYIKSSAEDPKGEATRFFPALGNHDYHAAGSGVFPARVKAYEAAFAVPEGPGGHQFYELARGPVRFFVLDSNTAPKEKLYKIGSAQETWFRERLAAATEPWKLAVFHHSPYQSSTKNQDEIHMRKWKFEDTNLTAVIAGHSHIYERVMKGAFPFFTNGLGGNAIYPFQSPRIKGSEVSYGQKAPGEADPPKFRRGAIFGEATPTTFTLEFWNASGRRIDHWPATAPDLTKTPVGVA